MRISDNLSVARKQLHLWAGLWSSCESEFSCLSQPLIICYRLFYERQSKTSLLNPGCRHHCLHWKCVSALPEGTSTASAGCLFDLLIAKRNKTPFCPRSRGTKWWQTTQKTLYKCVLCSQKHMTKSDFKLEASWVALNCDSINHPSDQANKQPQVLPPGCRRTNS